ncbi:MAG: chemotaxis protein CheA, partial [Planctomycetes bacterium]|nr:chemotaxis protein CheA [Planctomycetota bacterium]
MTREDHGDSSVKSLVEDLCRRSGAVDKEDLSMLAKMHGICEHLAQAINPNARRTDSLRNEATSLASALEVLILGDAADPDEVLRSALERVAIIAKTIGITWNPNRECDEGVPAANDGLQEMNDNEVAAKLDQIFDGPAKADNPPTPEDTPAPTAEAILASTVTPASASATSAGGNGAGTSSTSEPVQPPYQSEPLIVKESDAEFVQGFLEEAGEHLEAIESALLEVEQDPTDAEKINTLFRPFHTIKGMAGFLNLRDINCFTHEVETLLDQGRKGQRRVTPGLIDVVFDAVDILKVQIASIASWIVAPQGDTIPQPNITEMIAHLRDIIAGRIEPEGRMPAAGGADRKVGENLVDQGVVPQEIVDFAVQRQEQTGADRKVGEILTEMGAATAKQVSQAIRAQVVPKGDAPPRVAGPPKTGQTAGVGDLSVRIETAKLDGLVDMVGELVIAQTLVGSHPLVGTDPRLTKDVGQVGKIVRDVQEVAMSMRMVPIGPTFQKMARLVRDVSRKAGKEVQLIISGEETELDKNVIQQIGDPLVHMVRNAVDHGIEPSAVRREAGKPEIGQVHLSAFHQGGNIIIEIRDDGKGLDPVALRAKAIEKGLIRPDDELTEQQTFGLIFAPGFSMAKEVTDISGRGVGMDVVKRNIEQLRGRVDITSTKGEGSVFSIRLPLTLAIIDGMLVRVGTERFIIQTTTVEQSLRPRRNEITTVQNRGEVLNVRGQLVPLIQLGAMFGLSGHIDPCEAMVVIAQCDDGRLGLIVEELIGQQQVVIKSLGERFRELKGISGAAILGDGRVGLILETSGLQVLHSQWRTPALSAPSNPKVSVTTKSDHSTFQTTSFPE